MSSKVSCADIDITMNQNVQTEDKNLADLSVKRATDHNTLPNYDSAWRRVKIIPFPARYNCP